jgi:hypothetical protein
MKKKIATKKKAKYVPTDNKKEAERKKAIQEKRQHTINVKKRSDFIDYLYKKYSS